MWDRCCRIASDVQIAIPSSFLVRMNTFKDRLAEWLEGCLEMNLILYWFNNNSAIYQYQQ